MMDHLLLLDTFFGSELSTTLLINKYMLESQYLTDFQLISIPQS